MKSFDPVKLRALDARWNSSSARERANAQPYLIELCDALGVDPPQPAGAGYEFEYPVRVIGRDDGVEACNFIDLYKDGCFVLEAKQQERGRPNELLLQRAFGQAQAYARALPGEQPPYLLVLDIGRTLIVWDRWQGTYGSFATGRAINLPNLANLPEDVELLRDIWENPARRNPHTRAKQVTEEIAEKLANLARTLEDRGYDPERVARFMIRCVFTMFAEDTELLPERFFRRAIQAGIKRPVDFVENVEELWRAMDKGGRFYFQRLLRFNGHFFHESEALPLNPADLTLLLNASTAGWRHVEPAIFGTLLVRALDPAERHRLGAEYTPRSYVEQIIRATIEEPVREWWTSVQAEVLQLCDPMGKKPAIQQRDREHAVKQLRDFHQRLRSTQVLDPACGSGNFLYVALHSLKRIEREVLRTIEQISGQLDLEMEGIGPWQFHGIEVKPWAREIAELTLWIGYHQFWSQHYPGTCPPEPLLKQTGTLEMRDAVLEWTELQEDPSRSRPDPTPRIPHEVTGRMVPDPTARRAYQLHLNARATEWPRALFIIGNPPYMGQANQREAFGDGYVDALRAAYPDLPDNVDYVMYWWHRAAELVASGKVLRAGFITTNSIVQPQNRPVIERARRAGVDICWAVADHPWVDESGAADVRVALTVMMKNSPLAILATVDNTGRIVRETAVDKLNSDLTAHADVAGASSVPLRANEGLSSPGFKLHGAGFTLRTDEAQKLLTAEPQHQRVIRKYLNGRDIASRSRGLYVVDFGLLEEQEARRFPVLFDIVRSRVKPERDANARASYGRFWWRFGEPRREFRLALSGLPRFIATPETAKHRYFIFVDADVAPDNSIVCVASDDAFHLGVLSSSIHVYWSNAAGGRLGIGNDPRYTKTRCFDPFPFPDASPELRTRIAEIAEQLDRHRWGALIRDQTVTLTGMYNVVEKLRTGSPLDAAERATHDLGACGVLLDLHDELDTAVAKAYGWQWPMDREEVLDRLVALHDDRLNEERNENVRWLRPDYQAAGSLFSSVLPQSAPHTAEEPAIPVQQAWPSATKEQIAALLAAIACEPLSIEEAVAKFEGARSSVVAHHLETLSWMGEVRKGLQERYHATRRLTLRQRRASHNPGGRWPSQSRVRSSQHIPTGG